MSTKGVARRGPWWWKVARRRLSLLGIPRRARPEAAPARQADSAPLGGPRTGLRKVVEATGGRPPSVRAYARPEDEFQCSGDLAGKKFGFPYTNAYWEEEFGCSAEKVIELVEPRLDTCAWPVMWPVRSTRTVPLGPAAKAPVPASPATGRKASRWNVSPGLLQ